MTDTKAVSWLTPQPNELRVLHVEDNELDAELVAQALRNGGFSFSVVVVQTETEFERQLRLQSPDVVIADYNLPQWKGMEALDVLRREGLDIPTDPGLGRARRRTAVECIKRGATDYVLKDGLARLPEAVRRALQEKRSFVCAGKRNRIWRGKSRSWPAPTRTSSNSLISHRMICRSRCAWWRPIRNCSAERYRGRLDENADKFIGYASEGALRMQSLIQDLLAFSRVGRNGDACGRVDCDAVMEEILLSLGPAIEESGAVVTHADAAGGLGGPLADDADLPESDRKRDQVSRERTAGDLRAGRESGRAVVVQRER